MLRPALLSVAGQTHPALEIIFVDNNSTDGSAAAAEGLLSEAGRPYRIVRCETPGANAARNFGYRFVSGDYVNWMDADDLMSADKIERQVAALEASPAYDIAYGDYSTRWFPPAYPPGEQNRTLAQVKDQIHRTLCGIWYPPHLYLVRRAAADRLQDAEAWAPDRMVTTDVEYSAVAALMGLHFQYVSGAHVTYNIWSKGQISGGTPYSARVRSLEAIFHRLRALAETAPSPPPLTARHKMLLDQDWTVWSLPRSTVSIARFAGRRARLRHLPTGREIEMRPREALVAKAMVDSGKALTSCHWGLMLTGTAPPVADDPADVVDTVQRLQREGFLVAFDRPAAAGDSR